LRLTMLAVAAALISSGGCSEHVTTEAEPQAGILWVRNAAEFQALCLQAYRAANDFLDTAISDEKWSALPDQVNAETLPTAIILDVDETVVTNVDFQIILEPPFRNHKLDNWNAANQAEAIPGAVEFIKNVQAAGVETFFITNRPCEAKAGIDDPCPQQAVTLQDLTEAGITTDEAHVMLANERPEWDREKVTRRNHIAQSYRVIMLLGDDLGDFIQCTRKRALDPCTEGASVASRRSATVQHGDRWGAGWFVLPNPMHGSWTSVN
jgi:5'-nucleotidase (lipoprotein e(P4) family)